VGHIKSVEAFEALNEHLSEPLLRTLEDQVEDPVEDQVDGQVHPRAMAFFGGLNQQARDKEPYLCTLFSIDFVAAARQLKIPRSFIHSWPIDRDVAACNNPVMMQKYPKLHELRSNQVARCTDSALLAIECGD
jgi:hypothetical protein